MDYEIAMVLLARLHRFDGLARRALDDLARYFYRYGPTARLDGYRRHLDWCNEDQRLNRFMSHREARSEESESIGHIDLSPSA